MAKMLYQAEKIIGKRVNSSTIAENTGNLIIKKIFTNKLTILIVNKA